MRVIKCKTQLLLIVIGFLFTFFSMNNLYCKIHDDRSYNLLQEQYYASNGQWEKIIQLADNQKDVYFISYLNLALAHKGQLISRICEFKQHSLSVLIGQNPKSKQTLKLMSQIYFYWGYLAGAQQAAFETNLMSPGGYDVEALKMLVRTNLIFGAYNVAEKYISCLEKTLFYRKWATSQRYFLKNKNAIKSDSLLGNLVKCIPLNDNYIRANGLGNDLRDIINVNPQQTGAVQFYVAYLILSQDEGRLTDFFKEYNGKIMQ